MSNNAHPTDAAIAQANELMPCPFCGGAADVYFNRHGNVGSVSVECCACKNGTGYWRTEKTAIERWNRRTPARELDAEKGGALLTNPHTGTPRDYRDVESDPAGILIHKADEPLYATPPAQAAEGVEMVARALADFDDENIYLWPGITDENRDHYRRMARAAIGAMGGG